MTPDDFLKWSIKLNDKFDKDDAKLFIRIANAVIDCESRISNKLEYTFKSLDADVTRNIQMRDGIQKRLNKETVSET